MPQEFVHDVLTVMNSCGMYNYAGQWSYEVGIPAKSGVSGSVAAVIPGQIGIAAFSPRLDKFGNSVRAIAACRRIAEDFGLHVFRTAPNPLEAIRGELSGAEIRSKRGRSFEQREILDRAGAGIRVIEAQGALFFGSAERIVRRVESLKAKADYIIVDFRRVYSVDAAACALIGRTIEHFSDVDQRLVFAGLAGRKEVAALARIVAAQTACPHFLDRDAALEWCETRLLSSHHVPWHKESHLTLDNIMLFDGLSQKALHELEKIAQKAEFDAGDVLIKEDDKADRFLIVMHGSVSVRLDLGGHGERSVRLAAFGPASTVGEMALLAGSRRSADVVADEPTTCLSFKLEAFWRLADKIKGMREIVLVNLARDLSTRLRAANREVRALEE
jgi:glutaminase